MTSVEMTAFIQRLLNMFLNVCMNKVMFTSVQCYYNVR